MSPLLDMIAGLRDQGAVLNPPASPAQLSALERTVNGPLPPDVRTLYESHDGQPHCLDAEGQETGQLSRLVTIEELLETLRDIADEYSEYGDITRQFLPLWTDGSDYDVLFLEEPLRGRVAYSSHELGGLVLRPTFRNITSYYAVVICEMIHRHDDLLGPAFFGSVQLRDYPTARPHPETDPTDELAFRHCLERCRNAADKTRRLYYGFNAAYLCPYLRTDEMLPLLEDDDSHFVGDACQILRRRNWPKAVPALRNVVRRGGSLSAGPAIEALESTTEPAAIEELIRLASELSATSPGALFGITNALKRRGVEVRTTQEATYTPSGVLVPARYQFRRRRDTAWQNLG